MKDICGLSLPKTCALKAPINPRQTYVTCDLFICITYTIIVILSSLPLSWSETKSANGSLGASDSDLDLVGTEVGCRGTLDIKDGVAVCGANGIGVPRTAGRDVFFLGDIALVIVGVAVDIGGGTKESENGFNGFMGGATDALN